MYKLQVSRDEDPNFSLFAFKLNMPHGKTCSGEVCVKLAPPFSKQVVRPGISPLLGDSSRRPVRSAPPTWADFSL